MICMITLSSNLFGQLKINNAGSVGIGTNSPQGKLDVQGKVYFAAGGHEIRFIPNNPGPEIGSSTGSMNFWHTGGSWTTLYAWHFVAMSDSTLKKDITRLNECSSIIKKLNGHKYHFIKPQSNSTNEQKYDYGVLAQEVERVLPDLVYESKGSKGVDYIGLIPVLIEAMKEQIKLVEDSNKKIDSLSSVISQCCSNNQTFQSTQSQTQNTSNSINVNSSTINIATSKGKLYQNTPNPFNNETKIEYELTETSQSASIAVFDLQGNFKKSYSLDSNKKGNIIIQAGEFNQGMYIYTLIIDHQEIDSKKMILIE